MASSISSLLQISASGLLARMTDLDTVSNNLANLYSNGYKASRLNFQELLNEKNQINGTQSRSTQRLMSQGAIRTSTNSLDMALQGDGYFAVQLQDGRIGYTRDGAFQLDASGAIVDQNGRPLVWNGQVPADATKIEVKNDGTVIAMVNDAWQTVGQIGLNKFANPSGLQTYGDNILLETEVSGPVQSGAANTQGFAQVVGYALEGSNVNMANELTRMINLQKEFSMSIKALQQSDSMIELAVRMR
jgi:flagellar basal-body rod protein FlgG